jgi:NADH-quinone oxidoreductase subunit J
MNVIMFYLLSAVILGCAVLSVTTRKILRAATYLLFVLIATAGLYFLLEVFFLGAVQLMLYAGGIVVLIVFSILLTHNIDHKFESLELKKKLFTGLASAIGAVVCLIAINQTTFTATQSPAISTNVRQFGLQLLSYGNYGYVLPFEVISILLLAAMVAAIMIAKK